MNKFLPVHEPSRRYAYELGKGCSTKLEKWFVITSYMNKTFVYDYVRAILIPKKNGLPDLDRTWDLHKGVCLDIASLTVGMLKAVGIDARLVFGLADKKYHAWVEAKIDGKIYRYDHSNPKDNKVKKYKTINSFS